MSLTMTESAIKRVKKLKRMRQTSDSLFRVKITTGGCSGLSYIFDLVQEPHADDMIFVFDDTKVCIDKKSYLFLKGTEIDYVDTLMMSGFKLMNPATQRECSCGDSFAI